MQEGANELIEMAEALERIMESLEKKDKWKKRKKGIKYSDMVRAFMHPNPSAKNIKRTMEDYCRIYHKCSVEKFTALHSQFVDKDK